MFLVSLMLPPVTSAEESSPAVLTSVHDSSVANAVTGNKLIAMHSDRNTAKIFFFTCVFLLLWIFSLG